MNQAYSRQPVKVTHLNNMRRQLKSGRENCIKSNQQHDFITDCLDIYFCLFFFFALEASKVVMQYVAAVSGKGWEVDRVKEQLLQSNPVLEGE